MKNLIFEKKNFFFSIMKSTFKNIFKILKKKYFFKKLNYNFRTFDGVAHPLEDLKKKLFLTEI